MQTCCSIRVYVQVVFCILAIYLGSWQGPLVPWRALFFSMGPIATLKRSLAQERLSLLR